MIAAIGHSEDPDAAEAVADALKQCAVKLEGKTPQAGLLFAGIDHDCQALLDGITARYPDLQLIGCTTHGELSSKGFAEDSVALLLLHSERVRFRVGIGEEARADPEGAACRAARMALDGLDEQARLGITLPDSLGTDLAVILRTLSAEVGHDVPMCGGGAGDQGRFMGTYQFCNGRVYSDAVPVLLFFGPLNVSAGVASGWEPLGESRRVTRAVGPLVSEIDGEPVRDVWTHYFGTAELNAARNVVAVYPDNVAGVGESTEFYLSAPYAFEEGGLLMMNPIPTGARIRFATASRDQIVSGAGASAAHAWETYPGGRPGAALLFSCAGRHESLGTRVGAELDQLQAQIGAEVPTIGFYSSAEFCPLPYSRTPRTHSCTFVTVLIGEGA